MVAIWKVFAVATVAEVLSLPVPQVIATRRALAADWRLGQSRKHPAFGGCSGQAVCRRHWADGEIQGLADLGVGGGGCPGSDQQVV